jgi:aspartyl-tRNA synthetase
MFDRTYIEEAKERIGETITLAGWVKRTRVLRNISFLVLRDLTGEIQVTVKDDDLRDLVEGLGREDVVKVTGSPVASDVARAGVEFVPDGIDVLNRAKQPLPFDLFGQVKAELDTRLNYRFMDFRTERTSAIFRIQNELLTSFRRFLTDRGYMEFQPPCVIASASEGGADLFMLPYFEKQAYLAQSPQLYKQMCAISFEKVFTVTPIWRAEKFNTPTHLNEIRQMDIEQAFADDETVMKVLEETLAHLLGAVKERCGEELELLGREINVPELPLKRITYTEAVEKLQEAGEEMIWGEDFTKAQERRLTELVGEEAFFLKDWPSVQKAFYAMPHEDNPDVVHAFDLLYGGIELSSGTQRVHMPELLREQLRKKGLNPENFTHYIDSFAYGAPPHAGWSIGLERLTMAVTGMQNIRECTMFPRDRDRLVP